MTKNYLKIIFRHFIIWTFAFTFWTVMREFGQEIATGFERLSLATYLFMQLVLGV